MGVSLGMGFVVPQRILTQSFRGADTYRRQLHVLSHLTLLL